jgi:hypothetical protein
LLLSQYQRRFPSDRAEGGLKPEHHAERSPASAITRVVVPNPPGDEAMAEKDLKALFLHQLKDTYFAEND